MSPLLWRFTHRVRAWWWWRTATEEQLRERLQRRRERLREFHRLNAPLWIIEREWELVREAQHHLARRQVADLLNGKRETVEVDR